LALALRLIWLDDEGCIPAVSFFIPWMRLAAQGGIARVFEVAESSYPPLTVYILQTLGWFGAVGTMDAAPTLIESLALRVTTAFFDLVTIALLYHIGRRVAGHWIAAGAALLYALCPADIYLSGWWIQIEAWFVLPALLGAWWLSRERVALAWAALGVAVSLKPQAAIIFPVFLVGTWRWWGFRRALMGGLVLLLVILLVFVPILVSGQGRAIVSKMFEPGYDFPWVSLRSYNMWFAVTERAREIGSDFHRDQNALAGYLSFHDVGWSLMALAYGLVLVRLFARSGPREIFVTCILAWFSFFLLPTRIHSRYVFPTQAFMLVAGFHRRRWWALYAVSAVTLFANLAVRACEISPSTCVLSLSLPTTMEIFFAWVNMAVGGLAIAFYLQPLWWPRDRQARLEGPLHVARGGWEKALLIGGGVLLLIIVCGVLWRGWTVGAELSVLEAPLQISLVDALERGAGEVVVVNWPHVIAAGDDAYLGGIVPVVPPALFFSVPEDTYPQATWVQYPPWQRDDLKIDYHGAYVTQPELMEQVRESHRVLGFSPALDEMVALAEREDPALVGRCLAQFDDLVCLSEARAVVQDGVLQVELIWQIHGALSPSTTVFVHVVDEEGNLVVQADGDPVNGLLPLSAWRASDAALSETRLVSVSERAVDRVWMGLYNRTTGNRLPVQCGPAQTCVNGAVQIAGP
jgi:Gpi18-like mannosyltransferase